jgi:DNA-directed RNA polymerase subunit H
MVLSVKKRKIKMLETLLKEDLEKIAEVEHIPIEGTKEEILNKLSSRLNLQKTRDYVKKLVLRQSLDIFSHDLVPKHKVLSDKEKESVLKNYGINIGQLPRISIRDSAVLSINAEPGDVIEITRKSPIAGEIKYYRVISKPKK